jgi:capsular polysaccharide biosynthesis protein
MIHYSPGTARVAPDRPLRVSSISALIGDPIAAAEAGLHDVQQLAPQGSYRRRPAVVVNLAELYPAFHGYADDLRKLEQPYPPILGMVLPDAQVVGQGSVVTRDGVLVRDSCRAIIEQNLQPPGLQAIGSDLFCRPPPGARKLEPLSLLAKGPWWRNFGHWLVDSAALLALVVDRLRDHEFQIVIGKQTDPGMRRIVRETLDILAPGVPIVEHDDSDAVTFSRLYYITPVSISPLFKSPQAIHALRDRLLPRRAVRGRRLYVTRHHDPRRRLLNEPDVVGLCEARGFEIIRPEQYTLCDQARMFSEAEIVVGVKGAALTNLLFGAPESSAIVLSPNNWAEAFFWDIAGQLDISYVEILGKVVEGVTEPPGSPFSIDLPLLAAALDNAGAPKLPGHAASSQEHTGLFYRECLHLIHQILKPRAYLEVGCLDGETLALAACPAIGIDVQFQPKITVSSNATTLMLFQMASDEFFKKHNPFLFLERRIDLAFLDGMHLIENLLRDFINTERFCDPDGVVLLHDCLPLDPHMATRDMSDVSRRAMSSQPTWWTGDVWKILPILSSYRPDLTVHAFNAPPTGLVMVTGLDPDNRVLEREFDSIMARYRVPPDEYELFCQNIPAARVRDTAELAELIKTRLGGHRVGILADRESHT